MFQSSLSELRGLMSVMREDTVEGAGPGHHVARKIDASYHRDFVRAAGLPAQMLNELLNSANVSSFSNDGSRTSSHIQP